MEEKSVKKSNHGGARPGAGRKKTTAKAYMVYATQEVADILEAVEGSKSEFICQCIMYWRQHH